MTSAINALIIAFLLFAVSNANAFYQPVQGRWLSRDPAGERVGHNLYAALANSGPTTVDALGMAAKSETFSLNGTHSITVKKTVGLVGVKQQVDITFDVDYEIDVNLSVDGSEVTFDDTMIHKAMVIRPTRQSAVFVPVMDKTTKILLEIARRLARKLAGGSSIPLEVLLRSIDATSELRGVTKVTLNGDPSIGNGKIDYEGCPPGDCRKCYEISQDLLVNASLQLVGIARVKAIEESKKEAKSAAWTALDSLTAADDYCTECEKCP